MWSVELINPHATKLIARICLLLLPRLLCLLFWSQKTSSPVVQAGLQFAVLNWNSWSSCRHLPIVGMTGVYHCALPVCFIFSILQWNWKRILRERRAQLLHARVVVLMVRSQHFSLAAECLMALLDLNTRERVGSSRWEREPSPHSGETLSRKVSRLVYLMYHWSWMWSLGLRVSGLDIIVSQRLWKLRGA